MGLPIVSSRATRQPAQPLPTVVALEALWQKFQGARVWLPVRLWRRFRVAQTLNTQTVEAKAVRVVAPVGKVNDCGGCTELCCVGQHNAVLLRLRDIATLIDVGRTDLIATRKPHFTAQTLAARPALRLHTASEAWRRFPVLAQNSFGACMALSEAGQCGLYPHWPMSCARFPYALDADTAEVFYSKRCQSYFVHPREADRVQEMAASAVAGYNQRIQDALLLRFCAESLADLGLLRYLVE